MVSEEIENDLNINYSYSAQGLVETASFSDENKIDFSDYSDGSIKQKTTNTQETYYTSSGQLEKVVIGGHV